MPFHPVISIYLDVNDVGESVLAIVMTWKAFLENVAFMPATCSMQHMVTHPKRRFVRLAYNGGAILAFLFMVHPLLVFISCLLIPNTVSVVVGGGNR